MVSDGAPALIKLALSGLACVSVADLFHALRALARPIGSAIGRQVSHCNQQAQMLQQKYLKTVNESRGQSIKPTLADIQAQQQILAEDKTTYHHENSCINILWYD